MKVFYGLIFGITVCFFSCNNEPKEYVPDVSTISANGDIVRFDKDIIELDTNNIDEAVQKLQTTYPYLTSLYFEKVIALKGENERELNKNIRNFITNSNTRELFDTVNLVYPDLKKLNSEFLKGFKYFKHYFPDFEEPNLYSIVSEFGYQRFIFEDGEKDGVGIGLDMFLGSNFPYKGLDPQNPSFSDYLTRSFNEDHIVKKVFELILEDRFPEPSGVRMIDQMVYNGKKLFILDKLLPFKSDSVIIEFSKEQLDWCKENELEMWSFFVDENLLYETNQQKINKYLNPSPNSPGMPEIAPGRTANYIGWQVIKSYMKKYPEMSFTELLAKSDSQKLLEEARYRPKK